MAWVAPLIGAAGSIAGGLLSAKSSSSKQKASSPQLTSLTPTDPLIRELLGYGRVGWYDVGGKTQQSTKHLVNPLGQYGQDFSGFGGFDFSPWGGKVVDLSGTGGYGSGSQLPFGNSGAPSAGRGGISVNPLASTLVGGGLAGVTGGLSLIPGVGSTITKGLSKLPLVGGLFGKKKKSKVKYKEQDERVNYGVFNPTYEGLTPLQALGRAYVYGDTQNRYQNEVPLASLEQAGSAMNDWTTGPLADVVRLADELARTGNPTDISSIIKAAQRRYQTEDLPAITQQYAPQTGLFSTDFQNASQRRLKDIETELGQLDYNAREAAAQRRVQGIPILSAMRQANVAMPVSYAQDAFNLGSQIEQLTPSARMFQQLGGLSNLASQQNYVQQGYSPFGSASNASLMGLASAIPQIASGVKDIVGLFQKPSTTTPTTP
jgi:hypothetical protein